jgi:hypothetical protein
VRAAVIIDRGEEQMSYRQRERKRRKKAAAGAAGDVGEWWLILARKDCACARCGGWFRAGREMVFRHNPRELRCVMCVESGTYRPSARWGEARLREMKRKGGCDVRRQ